MSTGSVLSNYTNSMRLSGLVVWGTILLGVASTANATNLFSENFDSLPFGLYSALPEPGSSGSALGHFTVTSGSVDLLGGGFAFLCVAPTTSLCVDINGNEAGTIASPPISLAPGNYTLTYVVTGSQRQAVQASATVSLGSLFSQLYTYPYTFVPTGPTSNPIVVTAPTVVQLIISSDTAGATGLIFDSISLDTADVAIPEPGSLTASGLMLLVPLFLRKRINS